MATRDERRQAAKVEVWVGGELWRPVEDLAAAGPDDRVFAFDPETGAVRFGDGVCGRRPETGAVVRATFHYGAGREHSVTHPWPLAAASFTVELAAGGEIAGRLGLSGGAEIAALKRVHYFEGQLLSARDLQAEQDYLREKRRLHARRLHGTGIVDGLELAVDGETIRVNPGLAIDAHGEELVVPGPWVGCIPAGATGWIVSLAFAERETDPVASPGVPHGEAPRNSRVQEGFRIDFTTAPPAGAVALGRLVCERRAWSLDPRFQPPRVR